MSKYKLYQVDAFTDKLFSGNPAAVCPLSEWIDDGIMQKIAMENNLAETAFYVKKGEQYEIRWFTPNIEVDLCGHATLASAFVLFQYENHQGELIDFYSPRSGALKVTKNAKGFTLDFPVDEYHKISISEDIISCFNRKPIEVYKGKTDYMLVFENETDIVNITPQLENIKKLNARGVIITAKGKNVDFVSRFFAPQSGINEDPVTGSAHTTMTPYWAVKLNKNDLSAIQLSDRRGYLQCRFLENRVEISGQAKLYLTGEIHIQ
ncbi:PhzF family phenazine biosynthesis protein [Dysgonomonas sp. Marseille-P4677]|uniref:PhzF family phenazine biosynthesis protein n=1 Tax=Dysgonomonas sp. Marseille-P4677 TaxID=2364790 RepID=UPI001912A276|nr:PhzF family phenazine biosynthesis protein [Dysgonomonas sp. Marseille-P4677]MBK5719520.1 PhzF family phenazine biosynthesis protein [Dysgonomonas sp. Marseille-P4677]